MEKKKRHVQQHLHRETKSIRVCDAESFFSFWAKILKDYLMGFNGGTCFINRFLVLLVIHYLRQDRYNNQRGDPSWCIFLVFDLFSWEKDKSPGVLNFICPLLLFVYFVSFQGSSNFPGQYILFFWVGLCREDRLHRCFYRPLLSGPGASCL
jgi:hypothetical protein